jgi:hypothetical protein
MVVLLSRARICKLSLAGLFIFLLPALVSAQNLYLQKVELCSSENYCMDCGSPKATCSQFTLDQIADKINRKYIFKDSNGTLYFQVLVEPSGFSCVLSHSDLTGSALTADLIRLLNGNIWRPAVENGKKVSSSVNVMFRIADGRISGRMMRMDLSQLQPAGDPIVYNKTTSYSNPSLKSYQFTTWTKYNSPLPDNVSQAAAIDQKDILWYGTEKGLTRFNGEIFDPVNEYNSPFTNETAIQEITVDKDNDKWVYVNGGIYKSTEAGWQVFDFKKFIKSTVTHILNSRNGELLFTTKDGMVVVRKEKVVVLNKKTLPELPSSNVYYAYVDSRKRLWIGTSKGSIMLDGTLLPTPFNTSDTPLKNMCISGVTEDEKGNLYFSLISDNKIAGDDDREGIAVLKTDGTWLHYNDKNSGMPANRISTILYDKFEHVLWMGTEQSGLVRFDLKNGWETYHNTNSPSPSHTIYQLVQDSKGTIYATTANGLVRIRKKDGA